MTTPLVVVDADVLGRQRTGDETYVENLLGGLREAAGGLRLAAIVRRPELVPEGIEPLVLPVRSQELRMAWSVPRLLRRVRPALAHFVHAIPLACPCPAVLTVQDLSFEREGAVMGWKDRFVFRRVVPRAVRRAARVLAISERTKHDLVDLYDADPDRVVVTPLGVDPAFLPGAVQRNSYLLLVGTIERRKNPLAALAAARALGRPLVLVGPPKDTRLADELRKGGADVRGYVSKAELVDLYRRAACVLVPSAYEGFGLPVVEAMATATPVVAAPDRALKEVAGDAALYAEPEAFAPAIEQALVERDRLVRAGLERVRRFDWSETCRRTVDVYREVLAEQ